MNTPKPIRAFLVLAVLSLAVVPLQADQDAAQVRVVAQVANVRAAAELASPVVQTAKAGTVFPVIRKAGDWYLVGLPGGGQGYLNKTVVEEVSGAVPETVAPVRAQAAAPAGAQPPPAVPSAPSAPVSFSMILLRAGFFMASDSAYKDVYQNGLVYGGELRIGKNKIAAWLEGNYRAETGKFTVTKETTNLKVLVVEAGALYRIAAGALSPYAGAGVGYFNYSESSSVLPGVKKGQVGFSVIGGVSYVLGKRIVVDGRIKYSSCKMKPADFDIEIGGLTAGMGLGIRF